MVRVSKIIPFVAMVLIPLSWLIQIVYNNHIVSVLVGSDLSVGEISAIKELYVNIPMVNLITFATVVIPAIMVRKAVREGTKNMSKGETDED